MLNPNIRLAEGNIKSSNTKDVLFLIWNIPAIETCPYATEGCKFKCFAMKAQRNHAAVRVRRKLHLVETKKDTFVKDMIEHIEFHLSRPKMKNRICYFRIHSSGDYYSKEYFDKWIAITNHFKNNDKILFQCYTKSIPIIENYNLKDINIKFIFSLWGDTNPEHHRKALELKLPIFYASPKNELEEAVRLVGAVLCNGNCGECKECYTGNTEQIVIPYH